jgi:hypothetical protein
VNKKLDVKSFYVARKYKKIVNYFIFEVLQKKFFANFHRIIELFTKKICQKALQNMVLGSGIRDPGSGKNPFRIPDPGVKKAPDPGSGSATLVCSESTGSVENRHYD